jgi:hypothetical protein
MAISLMVCETVEGPRGGIGLADRDYRGRATNGRADGETRAIACVGLDGQWPQAPTSNEQSQPERREAHDAARGCHSGLREGWKPEGPRSTIPLAGSRGSARESPVRQCALWKAL